MVLRVGEWGTETGTNTEKDEEKEKSHITQEQTKQKERDAVKLHILKYITTFWLYKIKELQISVFMLYTLKYQHVWINGFKETNKTPV